MSFQQVELKKVKPNRLNPRLEFRKEPLDELPDSIESMGVPQPLILRPMKDGYEVVVGERRYRAAQQAGLDRVPAIVRDYTDDQVIELNVVENIQREDLTAVEKGKCIKQLMEDFPGKYPAGRSDYSDNSILIQDDEATDILLFHQLSSFSQGLLR